MTSTIQLQYVQRITAKIEKFASNNIFPAFSILRINCLDTNGNVVAIDIFTKDEIPLVMEGFMMKENPSNDDSKNTEGS